MLLDAKQNLKIADFGVARVEAINQSEMTGETGTYGYMAPEVINHCFETCFRCYVVQQNGRIWKCYFDNLNIILFNLALVGFKWQALQQKM